MCHPSVLQWAQRVIGEQDIAGRAVLEVGSLNVNGSVRPIIIGHSPRTYVGTDLVDGPGVDTTVPADQLARVFGFNSFEVVVSTEMLEHAQDWRNALANMTMVLAPGGLLILTTRSPGFPYHHPPDHWRYTPEVIKQALVALDLDVVELTLDPEYPGVFARAVKSRRKWDPNYPVLTDIHAEPMPQQQQQEDGQMADVKANPDKPLAGGAQAQQASQVRQALNELENAKRLGNAERVIAAEKTLRSLNVDPTASGIREAGRLLADDRVKGRSVEQRETADQQPETVDTSTIPGGGPDPAAPDPAKGNDPAQAGTTVSPEDDPKARAATTKAVDDANLGKGGGKKIESPDATGKPASEPGPKVAGADPAQTSSSSATAKTPGQGEPEKAAKAPKPKGADADKPGEPAGKGPATTDKGSPEGVKGKPSGASDKSK